MEISYESYDYVVLDASCLMFTIPAELWEYQKDHPLLAAKTFESECNGYEILLPAGKRALFAENKVRIAKSVCTESPFREAQYARKGFNQDALGMLRLLCGKSTRPVLQERNCLLVTGDLSQLESVWKYGVLADVMFLQNGVLYDHQNVKELEALFHYEEVPEENAGVFTHGDKRVAYKAGGVMVELTRIKETRRSACIYETPDSQYAKIFRKIRLTQNKMRHVERLVECGKELGLDWALFPTELIYADKDCQVPVGYLMKKAGNTLDITSTLRFDVESNSDQRWEDDKHTLYYEYLYLALMITRQTAYLKSYNIWPSDYNLENLALFWPQVLEPGEKPSGYPKLYMWDTDSFCWKGYVSNRWCVGLEPLSGYGGSVAEMCADALYQQVFSILTLGESPFSVNRENPPRFSFYKVASEKRKRFFYIPANLRRLFHDVFVCGYLPSVPCLLQELEQAYERERNAYDEETHISLQTTLEHLDQMAQQKAAEGTDFRPGTERTKLVLPSYPKASEVSAPLYVWSRPTTPFSAKRIRRREKEKTESGMGSE